MTANPSGLASMKYAPSTRLAAGSRLSGQNISTNKEKSSERERKRHTESKPEIDRERYRDAERERERYPKKC